MIYLLNIIGAMIIIYGLLAEKTFFIGIGFILSCCFLILAGNFDISNENNIRNKRQE